MEAMTTNGITISVETLYQHEHSRPFENKYIFAYQITIYNHNPFPVKLLRRRWCISDSNGLSHVVEGEGVVGQQPLLEYGQTYQYASWTNLLTDIGRMEGTYLFQREDSGETFEARIPPFDLVAPFKHN